MPRPFGSSKLSYTNPLLQRSSPARDLPSRQAIRRRLVFAFSQDFTVFGGSLGEPLAIPTAVPKPSMLE